MKITKEIIREASGGTGAFNSSQLAALGIKWPPEAGWTHREYTEIQIREFINRRDIRGKTRINTAPASVSQGSLF